LVLQDNGGDDLGIAADGIFKFHTQQTAYHVTVKPQPTGQTCSVANGTGTATAAVTTIQVVCAQVFSVGGTVTGLLGSGLVLQDNLGDNLTVSGTGSVPFTFATPLIAGATYAVTILNQPKNPNQSCSLSNAGGTIIGSVNTIQISCPQPKFSIGGSVTGLIIGPGDTLELQDNAGDNLFVTGDTPFTFPTPFTFGTLFSADVFLPPTSQPQPCNIFFASAVVTGNISDVLVDCQHNDWAWMFPASTPAINTYGTASLATYSAGQPILGPPFATANTNTPGGRDLPMAWTDNKGNRWLFGGQGFEVTHPTVSKVPGLLNDMWVWPSLFGNDTGWWSPGGWIPADIPIKVDNSVSPTQYSADTTSLQFKESLVNYGALGSGTSCAASAGCTKPPARWGGVTWNDAAGNLWMFGGQGNGGLLNDVWEFDLTSGPCSYDLTTNTGIYTNCKWIWQAGANVANQPTTATFPGARWGAAYYSDAVGNMWMFGGQGYDSTGNIGLLNDLWKYNIAGRTWTLVLPAATVTFNVNGAYGTQGTAAANNLPGGRQTAVLWAEPSGTTIWLFGGFGLDSNGTNLGVGQIGSVLNDLWKFDTGTGMWTWVSGSSTANQNGVYGTQATSNVATNAAASSVPGARWGSSGWVNPDGDLFLFGGFGYGSLATQPTGFLNDVWEYDVASGQWIWWKGSTDVNQPGTYITSPFSAFQINYANNAVGARRGAARWLPNSLGYVYFFGGEGYDSSSGGSYGELNDYWRYLPFP